MRNKRVTKNNSHTIVLLCIIGLVNANSSRVPLSCSDNKTDDGDIFYDYKSSILENGKLLCRMFSLKNILNADTKCVIA